MHNFITEPIVHNPPDAFLFLSPLNVRLRIVQNLEQPKVPIDGPILHIPNKVQEDTI